MKTNKEKPTFVLLDEISVSVSYDSRINAKKLRRLRRDVYGLACELGVHTEDRLIEFGEEVRVGVV